MFDRWWLWLFDLSRSLQSTVRDVRGRAAGTYFPTRCKDFNNTPCSDHTRRVPVLEPLNPILPLRGTSVQESKSPDHRSLANTNHSSFQFSRSLKS
jgi:hypothetical protein